MRLCLTILLAFAVLHDAGALAIDDLTPARHYQAALEHRQIAAAAVDSGEITASIASLETALSHQPGHGGILVNLAILSARTGNLTTTIEWLTEIDRRGLSYPASLLANALPEDARATLGPLLLAIEDNGAAAGIAETVVSIPFPDLLIESATEIDGIWYVSGIAEPGLYRLGQDTPENLLGDKDVASVFEIMAVDGLLWAATAVVPQTASESSNAGSAVLAIDPKTKVIVHRFDAPTPNARITDLAMTGSVLYFTDQDGGALYRADIATGAVSQMVSPGTFGSLQGITTSNDALYAADYATGLWRIDVLTGVMQRLTTANASLIGIDGLTADGSGGLIAIRNGGRPHGVLHLALSDEGTAIVAVTPLATGMPEFDDPTLGIVQDGRFVFIANSQWPSFPDDGSAPEEPRKPVLIMATPLPAQSD